MPPFGNQFQVNLNSGNEGGFLFALVIAGLIFWFFTLLSLLRRQDLPGTEKIVWVIVLCSLNVIGMLLYWFVAPAKQGTPNRTRTDKELKDYFNSRDTKSE